MTPSKPAGAVSAEPPATTRKFQHVEGFQDGTQWIEITSEGSFLVYPDGGRQRAPSYPLDVCLEKVARGIWKELAALRDESREPGDLIAIANSRLYDLATAEFQHLLDPNAGLDLTEVDRREMQRGSGRPWPAIAEAIRRLEDGLAIDGVILVKGTYEVTLDVQGRIVAHHRVRAESRETPDTKEHDGLQR